MQSCYKSLIGIIATCSATFACADVVEPQKSCELIFRKTQEDFVYIGGDCSQTFSIAFVSDENSLSSLNQRSLDFRAYIQSTNKSSNSKVLEKYAEARHRCGEAFCQVLFSSLDASLSKNGGFFNVFDLDIEIAAEPSIQIGGAINLLSEMLCSSYGGVILISYDGVSGGRYNYLSVSQINPNICKKVME